MKENVLKFLDNHWEAPMRVFFSDGTVEDCKFFGYNYDYDDNGNEIMDIDFERISDGMLIGGELSEIEKIEIL